MPYAYLLAASLCLLAACSPPGASAGHGLTWIEISTNDGWLVLVEADGSGYLAYGPVSGQRVSFPAETFHFGDLQRRIRQCSADYRGRHALISRIFSAGTPEIEQYYCKDSLIGQRWLGDAFRALPTEPRPARHYYGLCRRWRAEPPLGLAAR